MGISGKNHHFGNNPKGVPFGSCPLLKSAKEGFNLHFLTRVTILKFASTKGSLLRFRVPKNQLFGQFPGFAQAEYNLRNPLLLISAAQSWPHSAEFVAPFGFWPKLWFLAEIPISLHFQTISPKSGY